MAVAWDRVWVSICYVLVLLILAYEIWALIDNKPTTPPITNIFVAEVPWWITIPFLWWLAAHFTVAYAKVHNWPWIPKLPI